MKTKLNKIHVWKDVEWGKSLSLSLCGLRLFQGTNKPNAVSQRVAMYLYGDIKHWLCDNCVRSQYKLSENKN